VSNSIERDKLEATLGGVTMIASRQSIVLEALKLPADERAEVVQELLDSLTPDAGVLIDSTWEAELDRRLAAWEADPSTGIPWTELKSRQ
jgi:putative addiction module component (TIGR02574 family)